MSPLSIILLPRVKKGILSESREKSAQIIHCSQAKTVQNSSKQICGWILMSERTAGGLFHWRKGYDDPGVMARSNGLLTDGLEWCGLLVDYCEIISAFCQFGPSF